MTDAREETLRGLTGGIPYLQFLGMRFERSGDELTAVLPFTPHLIGNPVIPALHGGVTAAFLEVTAIVGLVWAGLGEGVQVSALPKTIDLTVDYLRAGQPKDSFARARINRSGRRYASVQVEAWQDDPARLFAQGNGHFLMP
ncbi:PaaI family thioesterase [Pseudogemmobacter blasticus]|uniref:Thioesterase n=1 Tax=Fuscovulum blasticum DSM 2131 TaxID=1188250 RepID=A0A2T4JCK5_FUSBL|nr:PaaI family thioesterase [Fuscovulum blasticum]PTE15642.1 thioesterase [Fuscovulum blasticum DSM 2131]